MPHGPPEDATDLGDMDAGTHKRWAAVRYISLGQLLLLSSSSFGWEIPAGAFKNWALLPSNFPPLVFTNITDLVPALEAYAERHQLLNGEGCSDDAKCVARMLGANIVADLTNNPIQWHNPEQPISPPGQFDISFLPLESDPLSEARRYVARAQAKFGGLAIHSYTEVKECDERCAIVSIAIALEAERRHRGFFPDTHANSGTCKLMEPAIDQPAYIGGGVDDGASVSLPATCTEPNQREPLPAYQSRASGGDAAFVPSTRAEMLTSIYTLWNVLDRNMERAGASQHSYGYIRPVQLQALLGIIQPRKWRGEENGQRRRGLYCEVGFNGGHSAAAALAAGMNVVSFDFGNFSYSYGAVAFLHLAYGEDRFSLVRGDSRITVPEALHGRESLRGQCDVLFVDGSHSFEGVKADLTNLAPLAATGNAALIDDTQCSTLECTWEDMRGPCFGQMGFGASPLPDDHVKRAAEEALREGTLASLNITQFPCGHACNPPLPGPNGPIFQRWGYAKAKFSVG